jgi:hypothetical protein
LIYSVVNWLDVESTTASLDVTATRAGAEHYLVAGAEHYLVLLP